MSLRNASRVTKITWARINVTAITILRLETAAMMCDPHKKGTPFHTTVANTSGQSKIRIALREFPLFVDKSSASVRPLSLQCASLGVHPKTGEQLGNNCSRKPAKTECYDTREGLTNQQHARFLL